MPPKVFIEFILDLLKLYIFLVGFLGKYLSALVFIISPLWAYMALVNISGLNDFLFNSFQTAHELLYPESDPVTDEDLEEAFREHYSDSGSFGFWGDMLNVVVKLYVLFFLMLITTLLYCPFVYRLSKDIDIDKIKEQFSKVTSHLSKVE